jgi:hypothetical protein
MQKRVCLGLLVWIGVCLGNRSTAAQTPEPEDRFIAGYAAAILERELKLSSLTIEVRDGVIVIDPTGLGRIERDRIARSLAQVRGVRRVVFVEPDAPAIPRTPEEGDVTPGATVPEPETEAPPAADVAPTRVPINAAPQFVLAPSRLIDPLLADPRWPHFYATYQYRLDDGEIEHVGSVGFGETFSLVRQQLTESRRWELGIQAGVFAIFDLNSESSDLINADYFVGPFFAYRDGNFSSMLRIYHQSSHLGDEYLLRPDVDGNERINLSYEVIDLLLSYELPAGFRVYGGGGWIFHKEPADLKGGLAQYGIEYRSPYTFGGDLYRPIAAADFQHREESGWDLDLSVRAGVQIEDPRGVSQTVQFLIEYYRGRSPNGQFFDEQIESIGFGVHFYF